MSEDEMPWIFEPHGAFRSGLEGDDWPLGYISEGPGKPVFALHEVIGERPVEELLAAARLIAAAPDLLEAAEIVLAGLNERIERAPVGNVPVFAGIAALHDAIAKARGEAA